MERWVGGFYEGRNHKATHRQRDRGSAGAKGRLINISYITSGRETS